MTDRRDAALLMAVNRIGVLRAAVVEARKTMIATTECGDGAATGAVDLAVVWLDRFGPLGVLPEVEVEDDDDDPEGTPTEGALWEREDARSTPEARAERAAWARDVADILRAQVNGVPDEQKPGFRAAADLLDPRP